MAQLFLQTNMGQAAQNALERAAVESPNDPEAYTVMGEIAIQQRRLAEARLLYEKANSLLSGFSGSATRKAALQKIVLSGLARTDQLRENWTAAQKELEDLAQAGSHARIPRPCSNSPAACFSKRTWTGALAKLKEAAKIEQAKIDKETAKRPPTEKRNSSRRF